MQLDFSDDAMPLWAQLLMAGITAVGVIAVGKAIVTGLASRRPPPHSVPPSNVSPEARKSSAPARSARCNPTPGHKLRSAVRLRRRHDWLSGAEIASTSSSPTPPSRRLATAPICRCARWSSALSARNAAARRSISCSPVRGDKRDASAPGTSRETATGSQRRRGDKAATGTPSKNG
jgi:hypothetical protein